MASVWSQAESNGRTYYYNTVTKATQWTKPEELMTPSEVCFSSLCELILVVPNKNTASARKSAMEAAYQSRRQTLLVSQRNQSDNVGDAGGIQECFGPDFPAAKASDAVSHGPSFLANALKHWQGTSICRWWHKFLFVAIATA